MRVIGGQLRSRRLKTLPGPAVRPTPDRLRETLFDVLGEEVAGRVFVDAYAGTGAVGIEALSRRASRAVFVENNRRAVALIQENLRTLGLEGRAAVIERNAAGVLAEARGDIVFLDPPYREAGEYRQALAALGRGGGPFLVIVQHDRRLELEPAYGTLARVRVLKQGDNALSLYRRPVPLPTGEILDS
jgi:16S rRNA (guanine(966)-N(2))-methyltransferase RsmD